MQKTLQAVLPCMSWFIVSLVCISARRGEWIKTKRIFRLSPEGRL
ncbi:hypothetical protein RBSWK_05946 [Rhodopirellula baltica SWK14]|uniref:Uncharacterized protein n=1 Tax=Rhodopirellula baltica SWK14 TaxID=993516 RepID=L7C7E3_RHOBT|nr:hypothetical protein RBSWK_05946 [Rhodopirellula baltica SWK14]